MNDLDRDVEHIMLAMSQTDPDKFQELCSLMGVDPIDFAEFLKSDTKQQDH